MNIETHPVTAQTLIEYSTIPMKYEVESTFSTELLNDGLRGIVFTEEKISPSYMKDYDALEDEGPTRWVKKFDTRNWAMFLARKDEITIGGATVVFRTPSVFMLGGRDDITVLWDIRVAPEHQRSGVGSALFGAAVDWAKNNSCDYLKIETQNTNVPACRFYRKQGCHLGEINCFAYTKPRVAHDVMLVWYLDLQER